MSQRPPRRGTRISDRPIWFEFNGRRYEALDGDTAASALLANGIRCCGRSVKSRRLRGILSAGPEEPNALMTVQHDGNAIPNVPATQLVLKDGLAFRSQNTWPSIRFDLASGLQLIGGFLGAGFYYKTFFRPSWRTYERLIRRLAGLGAAPRDCSLPPPTIEHLNCDVLVAGGGPAGLLAARSAAREGRAVVLCERESRWGGELEFETAVIEGFPADDWIRVTIGELERHNVRLLNHTAVVGGHAGYVVAHTEKDGLPGNNVVFHIHSRQVIVATGAIERPIAFRNNDLPGVMLLGAADRLSARYGVIPGHKAVIFANHSRAYSIAERLRRAGLAIAAIVDSRHENQISAAALSARASLMQSGVNCLIGHEITAARGFGTVSGAHIAPHESGAPTRVIPCDTILMSGGWSPSLHMASQGAAQKRFEAGIGSFVIDNLPGAAQSVGAARGILALSDIGVNLNATGDLPPGAVPFWRSWATRAQEKHQFVDFQNDVTVADLRIAVEEGFIDIEHAKRYTALGFGTDQGRIAGVLGAAIVSELQGKQLEDVGISRLRVPFQSVTLNSIAGLRRDNSLRVARHTPLHSWHADNGAVFETSGLWLRPRCYLGDHSSTQAAAINEAAGVRKKGGIADVSTLGKLEIRGPDAAAFLDHVYLTKASGLAVGRSRYGVCLREDGMVLDDGLILRLAPSHFRVTTSSGHAGHMLSHFEFYRYTDWGKAAIAITDVTDAWAAIAVSGPAAMDAVAQLVRSNFRAQITHLKRMQFTVLSAHGFPLIVLRASFAGETGCEVHCSPQIASSVWQQLVNQGMQPYGLDAMDILRIEKGFLTHAEINGRTSPFDLNMQRSMQRDSNYVGCKLLERPAFHEPARPRLVGIRAADHRSTFLTGAQVVVESKPDYSCGYVTSSAFSPTLGEWIGLALVSRALPLGLPVLVRDPLRNSDMRAQLTPTVHLDAALP